MVKTSKVISLVLLSSLLLLTALSFTAVNVNAQSKANVNILGSIGGDTNPTAGNYSYDDGTSVTLTATANTGAFFSYWIISTDSQSRQSSTNPLTFTVSAGSTYDIQPVFTIIQTVGSQVGLPTNNPNTALVTILSASGGTTIPAPGTYAFTNLTAFNITAMPDNGWQFSHWVISGSDITTGHGSIPTNLEPTDNPYNVNHGYGSIYSYQPVFTQTNASPSPTIPEFSALGLVAILVAMIPFVLVARKRRKRVS